ncbi:MAG: DUF2505 domain-containing protein [Planctomycetota bacterium]|nr:DUF2505 domain-containing protein [Planctomycetota bacterium]
MEVKVSQDYPVAIDLVLARFLDSDYLLRKYQTIGAQNPVVLESSGDDKRWKIVLQREVEADVPTFAKKFFRPTNTVLETDEWVLTDPSTKQCHYVAHIAKAPVSITGTITLISLNDGGCRHEIACHIAVKIPLIGKKIAALVGEQTRESLVKELAFNLAECTSNSLGGSGG